MPNGKETERRPTPEVFVVRKGRQEELHQYYTTQCRSLFGSDACVDGKGNIFYPTWHQVKREKVNPEIYSLLSRKREGEESYLARELVTKSIYELRINQIREDGGSVEAGIRSVDHGLKTELKRELPQLEMVGKRVGELYQLFADFSEVTDEEFERAKRKTYRHLAVVQLDPEKVLLEEKKRMTEWLIKASGGRDSIERKNWLISVMALGAAYRRAVDRRMGVGETISKFVRMREALLFAREFSREIIKEVLERLAPQRIPAHYLFRYPDKPPRNAGVVKGMLETMQWQLTQPPVRPYRPASLAVGEILGKTVNFLEQDRRQDIVKKEHFRKAREILETALISYQAIYPDLQ